jgi:hypothetical protein
MSPAAMSSAFVADLDVIPIMGFLPTFSFVFDRWLQLEIV